MIGLLHYAVLKTRRDRSLFLFLLAPAVVLAALLGPSIAELRLRYPLALSRNMTPLQNATILTNMLGMAALGFATISTFWTFRAEMATRSVASFVVARRSITVIATLILFGLMTAAAAWLCGIAMVILLTAAVPANLTVLFAGTLGVAIACSSAAALVVAIAPQPANILWAYFSMIVFLPWVEKLPDSKQFALAAAIFAICTPLSTYFLRRKCAT